MCIGEDLLIFIFSIYYLSFIVFENDFLWENHSFFDELEWQTYNCVCMHACVRVWVLLFIDFYSDVLVPGFSFESEMHAQYWSVIVDTKVLVVASLLHCWYMISKFIFSF